MIFTSCILMLEQTLLKQILLIQQESLRKITNVEDLAYELNFQGGKLARKAVDDFLENNPNEHKFVAGVLGPTNRTCSMSPDVNDPGFRNINFDNLFHDYKNCISALVKAKVDIILSFSRQFLIL